MAFVVAYRGGTADYQSPVYLNTTLTDNKNLTAEVKNVVVSINDAARVENSDLVSYNKKVSSLLSSYSSKNWSTFTLAFMWNGRFPDIYARVHYYYVPMRAQYEGAFSTKNGTLISQIVYYSTF